MANCRLIRWLCNAIFNPIIFASKSTYSLYFTLCSWLCSQGSRPSGPSSDVLITGQVCIVIIFCGRSEVSTLLTLPSDTIDTLIQDNKQLDISEMNGNMFHPHQGLIGASGQVALVSAVRMHGQHQQTILQASGQMVYGHNSAVSHQFI